MSLIKPAKLLPIRFNLISIAGPDASGRQYRYNASLSLINPQTHSDSTQGSFYNLTDLNVGDYVSTNGGGKILKVITITAQTSQNATIIAEDELRLNQQQDPSGNSQGYIPSSEGIVFEVREGRPILFPYTQYSESIVGFIKTTAAEIISKFSYLRQDKLISIEQAGSAALGLAVGDIVTWDDTTNLWKLLTATDTACGVVVETANPVPNAFRINPAGDTIDIDLPDDGSGNLYYYWDTANPGKLTQTIPVGQKPSPIFLKIDDKKAIHFDGANVNAPTNIVTVDTTQTITGTKTFTNTTIFEQTITVAGDIEADSDLTVDGNTALNGTLDVTDTSTLGVLGAGETTLASATVSDLTDNRIVIAGVDGAIEDDVNLTFNGAQFSVGAGNFTVQQATGNTTIVGTLDVTDTSTLGVLGAGETTLASATVSDLTDNRIVIAGVDGAIEDDANLTFDGTDLTLGANTNLLVGGNVGITGNLVISGETTTVNTTNTVVTDQLIELNQGYAGPPMSADSGIVINRGPEDNLFVGWDETSNEFTVGTGTFDGSSTGTLTTTDANVRFAGIKSSTLTDNRILISGANGIIEDDTNLTWDGTDLSVTGAGVAFTTGKIGVGNQLSANVDHTMYVLYAATTDATPTQLNLSVGVSKIAIAINTTMQFEATIVGRQTGGTTHCSYKITGVIDNPGGTATLVNTVTETILAEDEESWVATAAPTGESLTITVTGEAATDIRWVAFVKTTSISF
tara:strand:- start:2150 stop:4375 length:2226 start_codon:yes stop_codon:yes gene_type:complete